jgi:tetratricopeptide (TPR) repeat protein
MIPLLPSLPVLTDAEEAALLAFEAAWESGARPTYLDALTPDAGIAFVRELVLIDLERRILSDLPVDVDGYMAAIPPAPGLEGIRRELLEAEDALRRRVRTRNGAAERPPARSAADRTALPSFCPVLPTIPGFRLVGLLGTGGMSLVYEAVDCRANAGASAGRRVAVKLIKTGAFASDQARQRFRQEVSVLARLRHVNVVDLIDSGTTADGHDYLVMEYLGGGVLHDSVRTPQEAARLVETLARAVGYFHRHQMVHRDLKPSNILLSHDGHTLKITDFGLAKCLDSGTRTTTEVVGTPLYMPPEQVFPKRSARVGPPADVYALGVLLYRVLSGAYPFPGLTPETIGRLCFEDPIPVRRHNPFVSAELDTICQKCLERQAGRRYANGDELADELARFQRRQRITARRVSVLGRCVRRAERNPILAFMAALLLITFLTAAVAGIYGTWKYTADLQAAKHFADRSRQRAEQARQRTRAALDDISSLVIEDWLSKQPRLEASQRAFLERALASYEEFGGEVGHTEEIRKSVADAYLRTGKIHALLGESAAAASAYQKADERFQGLVRDFPQSLQYRADLAASHQETAKVLTATGKPQQAATVFRAALDVLEPLAAEFPNDPRYQSQTVAILRGLGAALHRLGRTNEVETIYLRAVAIQEQVVAKSPAVPEYRLELAMTWNNLGFTLQATTEVEKAEAAYRKALDLKRELTVQFPGNARYRMTYARTLGNIANLLRDTRRMSEARDAYEQTREIQKRLVDDFPSVHEYRQELGGTYLTLGTLLVDMGRSAEAETAYRNALEVQKKLVADDPSVTMSHLELARVYRNMGILYARTGRPQDATSSYRQALAEYEALAARFPTELAHQTELAETLSRFAELMREKHDVPVVRKMLEQAGSISAAAIRSNPRNAEARRIYCQNRAVLAAILLETGEHASAALAASNLARFAVDPVTDRYRAACLLAQCMRQAHGDRRLDPAKRDSLIESYARQAMDLLGEALAQGYDDAAQLRTESNFEPLRSREEFRSLLAKIEEKARAFARKPK